MSDLDVKAVVRHRDGYRCVECGMTAQEHVRVYGTTLEVHRLKPGWPYTVEGCVTLCRECHKRKPGRRPRKYLPAASDIRRIRLDVDESHAVRLARAAHQMGLSLASFVRLLVEMYGNGPLTVEAIKAEAERRRGPLPEPKPKRPRGRPRKKPAGEGEG
jgi:hypothetical protein